MSIWVKNESKKYTDKLKKELENNMISLRNEITNSDFSKGDVGVYTRNSTYKIKDNVLIVTPASTNSGHVSFGFDEEYSEGDLGDLFYSSIKVKINTEDVRAVRLRLIDTQHRITKSSNPEMFTLGEFVTFSDYERLGRVINRPYGYYEFLERTELSSYEVKEPFTVNLTKFFGAGNEPTKEVFEGFLNNLKIKHFEGKRDVPQKQLFKYLLDEIKQSREGNITLSDLDVDLNTITNSPKNITVERIRDNKLKTTYFLTKINNNTFDGRKIVPKIKITASGADEADIKNVRDFISANSDEGVRYDVVINAGIQQPNGIGDGIIISDGVILRDAEQTTHLNQYTLAIDDDGFMKAFPHTVSAEDILSQGYTNAVVGFVPIVLDGEVAPMEVIELCPHYAQPNPRQVIGQFDNGDYIIMTVNGRLPKEKGMTLVEMAEILVELGVDFAYNLDGGGSTQTFIGKKRINQNYNRARPTLMTFETIDLLN